MKFHAAQGSMSIHVQWYCVRFQDFPDNNKERTKGFLKPFLISQIYVVFPKIQKAFSY